MSGNIFLSTIALRVTMDREKIGMTSGAGVVSVDHIGFSVSSLEQAIEFWTGAMGFQLLREGEMGGEFLLAVTGVDDPRCRFALVVAPDGFWIELLEYSTGPALGCAPPSAGAIGAAHLAITVTDMQAAIERVDAAGWRLKGAPRTIELGPRGGTTVTYVGGPDGITIELMQPPA